MILIDASELEKLEKKLDGIPKGVPKVIKSALKETSKRSGKKISDVIRDEYHLESKVSSIKEAISSKGPDGSGDEVSATIIVKSGATPLKDFKHSPKKMTFGRGKTLTATVKKGGGGAIPGAFKSVMRSGHTGIFKRMNGKFMAKTNVRGPYKGMQTRQAIDEAFGPSIAAMASSETSRPKIEEHIQETFEKRLDHHVERLLGGN